MIDPLISSIKTVRDNEVSFCKFVSANDAGETGAHQGGLYVPKTCSKLLFDTPGIKGTNKEKQATIKWSDGTVSDCRCIYYGKGSRNEYRITRLGKHLNIADLAVIVWINDKVYKGFLLTDARDIELFLLALNLRRADTNKIIKK